MVDSIAHTSELHNELNDQTKNEHNDELNDQPNNKHNDELNEESNAKLNNQSDNQSDDQRSEDFNAELWAPYTVRESEGPVCPDVVRSRWDTPYYALKALKEISHP